VGKRVLACPVRIRMNGDLREQSADHGLLGKWCISEGVIIALN